jgi:capsular exopolysaccharide synthesis family protein
MNSSPQRTTAVIDLLSPSNRFISSSRLHSRLGRCRFIGRRYWWVVALIQLVVLVPLYFFTAELPLTYRSKARLWLTGRLNLNEGRLYTEELLDYQATQAELLRSFTVRERALAKLRTRFTNDFAASPQPGNKRFWAPVHQIKAYVRALAGPGTAATNNAESDFPFSLKVTESSKSSTLELQALGAKPASTRAFLNCLIDEYFAFKRETREKGSDRTLASVRSEARKVEEELRAQQGRLQSFQSSNNVVFLQEQGNSAGSYLAQLNRQIASLRTRLRLLERLEPEQWIEAGSKHNDDIPGESPELAASETLASLVGPQTDLFRARQQMHLLKAKREELSQFLRPLHPKILKLNEEVATQEKLVQISKQEAVRQLTNRRQALQLELQNLESAFAEWDLKANEASRKIADYDRMRLDLQRLQAADDRLLGVIQTVDVSKTVDQENVGVLEAASPAQPVRRMAINMLAGIAGALLLSFVALYCLGLCDDRFASPVELTDCLSEEVLGQVPAVRLRNPRGQLPIQFLERQRFEFLESFRNLRSALWSLGNGAPRPKVILITSSVPREGKSTVALYLAATMALGNSRVLLIDADMRRAALHGFFAASPGPGLAEVLSGAQATGEVILPTSLNNLCLLPAGVAKRNPGELLLGNNWTRLLSELSPQFDYILVDSPPLLAADDAASLAPRVDGVLMLVRGSSTSARVAARGLDLLRQRRARVLGLVFSRSLCAADGYDHYQHFRHEYQWAPGSARRASALGYEPSPSAHQDVTVLSASMAKTATPGAKPAASHPG